MTQNELAPMLAAAGTSLLCSAHPGVQTTDISFVPISAGLRAAGRVRTVLARPLDNAAVHAAVHESTPGDFLAIEGGSIKTRALIGDLLAHCCIHRGVAGVVVRGSIRDVAALRALQCPVWSSGVNPGPARKEYISECTPILNWGGTEIVTGDWLVADDDGIAVMKPDIAAEVVVAATELAKREDAIRARIAAGETTYAILHLDELEPRGNHEPDEKFFPNY